MGNIHVKLYEIWTSGLGGDIMDKPLLIVAICIGKSIFPRIKGKNSTNNTGTFVQFVSLTKKIWTSGSVRDSVLELWQPI